MIKYYKTINYIYKTEGNKVYQYNGCDRIWNMWCYYTKQDFFRMYNPTPITLLDITMMGILE